MLSKQIEKAKKLIEGAEAIIITAGSGMGVDSGLPDFRGDTGFWKEYPVIKNLGISFEDMANPKWFATNPPLAWAFYGHRLNLYRDTIPHDGFEILLDLVKKKDDNYFIYTSNVDGQFQKAGFSEDKIVEIHGSIHHFQCSVSCTQEIWKADSNPIEIDMKKFEAMTIPKCKKCACIARPNILMFSDWNFIGDRTDTQNEKFRQWKKENRDKKKVVIEIGAGRAIPTIQEYGDKESRSTKTTLIRINPRESNVRETSAIGLALGGMEGIKEICLDSKIFDITNEKG